MNYIKTRPLLVMHLVTLLALCAILFFPHLGSFPFFNKGEPREALVVQEIVLHGDWLFPLKRGEEIPSKPPLFHWFAALTSLIWGQVTESTVRFPSALFATLGVLILYILGRRLFDPMVALFGGIILATSVGYQSQAISARVDMTLTFFVTLTLVIFYLLYRGFLTGGLWSYGFYLLLGVSVLAKGPVGLILPGMVICAFLGLKKRWDFLSRLCFHKGAVLALVIGISWYGMALMRGGEDFFTRQVIHENLARFFVYGEGGSGHQKPFYYYFSYLISGGLPWSLFLPFVIMDWFRNKTFIEDHSLFLMLWAGVIFLFFSLSAGKRSVYLLPLYPPLSLLIGLWLRRPTGGDRIRSVGLKSVGWFSVLVGFVLALFLLGIMAGEHFSGFLSYFGMMLKPKDQANLSIAMGTLGQAGWMFLLFLLLSSFLWFSTARHLFAMNSRAATAQLACLSLLTGLLVQGIAMPAIAEFRSYRSFMTEVDRRIGEEPLYIHGRGWDYTSAIFYRGDRIRVLKTDQLPLQEQLQKSRGYYIMSEREWKKMVALGAFTSPPELRSRGTGPDGRDPIVLIRGRQGGEGE